MPMIGGVYYPDDETTETPTEPVDPDTSVEPDPPSEIPSTPLEPSTPTIRPITKSIFLTIKKMLGVAEEYHAFDLDILIHINSVFLTLNQLGVGPTLPYQISGVDETWEDFLDAQHPFFAGVQTYVYLKTRLLFDPPTNSFLVSSIEKQCNEFEWRFVHQPKDQTQVDYVESFKRPLTAQNDSDEDESNPTEPEQPDEPSNEETQARKSKRNRDPYVTLFDIFG